MRFFAIIGVFHFNIFLQRFKIHTCHDIKKLFDWFVTKQNKQLGFFGAFFKMIAIMVWF